MTRLRGSNQGEERRSCHSYSASHITWIAEARFIARPLSALVQTIYGSVRHVNFLHLSAFILFYRMNELYESKRDLRSRMNNLSGWKRTCKNSGLTGNQANCRTSHCKFVIYLMVTNLQWPALQLAWLAQWIEHCVRPLQRSWFDSQSSLNFFQVLFQPFRLIILPRGSCSLSFLYPQLKRWSISYNYFNSESIILKIIRFGFCDIRNNLGQGKCYKSKPILRPWLFRFCLHCTTEHTKQHLEAWARWSARPMKYFINSREKLHCYSNSKNTPQPDS